jgi:hypothetical protein
MTSNSTLVKYLTLPLLLFALLFDGCDSASNKNTGEKRQVRPSFMAVKGIRFTEVRRTFNTGYSFADNGYQLAPMWRLSFPSDDSVTIYNPKRKLFVNAPVTFDHDSVFNVAWAWLRLKKLSKDSLIFQVLNVSAKVIDNEKSVVYMKLYADDYIKNKLHTDAHSLALPSRGDTLFVKKRIEAAKRNPDDLFAARQPVILKSTSKLVSVEKVTEPIDEKAFEEPAGNYLSPEYNIKIHHAYKDFNYSFSVVVDERGQLRFHKSLRYIYPEFRESQMRVMKGIVDGYLKAYLQVTPGQTLGTRQSSTIIVNVEGRKL